ETRRSILLYAKGFILENVDKDVPNDFPLLLRVTDAGQSLQKAIPRIDDVQVGMEMVVKSAANGIGLALAKQAVVQEDAGHLLAYRPHEKRRRHRGIDTAGQPANNAV